MVLRELEQRMFHFDGLLDELRKIMLELRLDYELFCIS